MKRILHSLIVLAICATTLSAQQVRNYNGRLNNPNNPEFGAVGAMMPRISPVTYGDGISTIDNNNRPNPRAVSNAVFAQSGLFNDPRNMSDYGWVWGQFLDHDITLVLDSEDFIYIQVPEGDVDFDPWSTGAALIPLRRSVGIQGTGYSADNPIQYANAITAFIDGSAVYGSSEERADWLRTHSGGKLKTSTGNLLPYNTTTGELNAPVDNNAPHMDDATGQLQRYFVAGDARANENVLLTSMHTLFLREHNRLCDELSAANPVWGDEKIFQEARRRVGAYMAAITYEEWLPTMGVHLDDYFAYVEYLNPSIYNEFAAAAYRFGHTLLNATIQRMDMEGNTLTEGNLELKDAFFRPDQVQNTGIECLLKGMGTQVMQDLDGKVINDVRNFLFGTPGAGGLDLAAINIARGRERGLADFNSIRVSLNLPPYTSFQNLTDDADLADILENELGYTIDNLDPWVGMLVEKHMPDALLGETVMDIMKKQFFNLREGDRFYYENDPAFSAEEVAEIKATRLKDILMRNTDIPTMQTNVFLAMPHEMLCTAVSSEATLAGTLQTIENENVSGVEISIINTNSDNSTLITSTDTGFEMNNIATCEAYEIKPSKNDDVTNGVTTSDLVNIRRHILNTVPFDSPYQYIAADANNSGAVTTSDLVEIRRLILVMIPEYTNNTSWRFVDANYQFPNPTNPWAEEFPESITTDAVLDNMSNVNFVAVKIGDVNNTASTNGFTGDSEERTAQAPFAFAVKDKELEAGQTYNVAFSAPSIASTEAFQFTLNYEDDLEFVAINGGTLPDFDANNYYALPNTNSITFSWNSNKVVNAQENLFYVTFKAKQSGKALSEVITLNSRYTVAEAYSDSDAKGIELQFNTENALTEKAFEVYQNTPNPVAVNTQIGIFMPQAGNALISFSDVSGRTLKVINKDLVQGLNTIEVSRRTLEASGVLYYTVETEYGVATKQMVLID